MNFIRHLTLREVAFWGIFLHISTLLPLMDPDYFWHLRTGQYLLENGHLPAGDIFSFTYPDKAWVLHEWLFEVLLHLVHVGLGDTGVRLLVGTLTLATLLVSYRTSLRFLGQAYEAFLLTLLVYLFLMQGMAPRPQLLTSLFLALTLRALIGHKYWGEKRGIWCLPVLMLPWVNVHAGYAVGLGLIGLFGLTEGLNHVLADEASAQRRERLKSLAKVLAASALVTLLNPYGYHHWLYPFEVMGLDLALSFINEWRSPDFHVLVYKLYLLTVLGYFILGAYRKTRPDVTEIVVPAAMVSLGFVSVRHVPLAALMLMPFLAMALADRVALHARQQMLMDKMLALYRKLRGEDLGGKEYALNLILALALAIGFPLYAGTREGVGQSEVNKMLPVKAVDFMQRHHVQCRLFSTYHYGGYLIERLYPDLKVFIDGRADMYGDDFMKEYIEASAGAERWAQVLDKYAIDCVLVGRDTPLRQLLLVRGDFAQVHLDEHHALLLARQPGFEDLIRRFEITAAR